MKVKNKFDRHRDTNIFSKDINMKIYIVKHEYFFQDIKTQIYFFKT